MKKNKKHLKLKGKTMVFVDWANVYGWRKSLKKEVDPKKLYKYLKSYPEIEKINFYFGKDKHPKSIQFHKNIKTIGYTLKSKPVKYLVVAKVGNKLIRERKCDFDIEITMDVFDAIVKNIDSFVFFSGDGDFEPLYKRLIKLDKQVVVVYTSGHLGREIWKLKKGIYKTEIIKMSQVLQR